jgi:hypothetical protein
MVDRITRGGSKLGRTTRRSLAKATTAFGFTLAATVLGATPAHASQSWVGGALNCYTHKVIVDSKSTGATHHGHTPAGGGGTYWADWNNGAVATIRISSFITNGSSFYVDTDKTLSSAKRACDW